MNERAPHCVAANDPWLREAVGAYLLGALEPAENDRVAAHLAVCANCRAEYGELAELLPLLASVSEAEAVNGPVRPEPAVLGRVLATTSLQLQDAYTQHQPQPGRRRWWGRRPGDARTQSAGGRVGMRSRIALAAGAAVLVAGGTGAGMMMSSAGAGLPTGSWKAAAIVGGTSYSGSAEHIQATVEVSPAKGGSSIHLTMDNVPAGYSCTMVVVGATGQQEPTGTWKANAEGSFAIPGWSYLTPDSIKSIQVDLPDGSTLLTLNHPH